MNTGGGGAKGDLDRRIGERERDNGDSGGEIENEGGVPGAEGGGGDLCEKFDPGCISIAPERGEAALGRAEERGGGGRAGIGEDVHAVVGGGTSGMDSERGRGRVKEISGERSSGVFEIIFAPATEQANEEGKKLFEDACV